MTDPKAGFHAFENRVLELKSGIIKSFELNYKDGDTMLDYVAAMLMAMNGLIAVQNDPTKCREDIVVMFDLIVKEGRTVRKKEKLNG